MKKIKSILQIILILSILFLGIIGVNALYKANAGDDATDTLTFETADTISISDLKKDGVLVGEKIILQEGATYTYNQTAAHGSTIFKFKYKVNSLNDLSCQFHFNKTYIDNDEVKNGGVIWLRNDKHYLSKTGGGYLNTNTFGALGIYDIEMGSLYIEEGNTTAITDSNYSKAGNYYVYLKVDGELKLEYYLANMPNNGSLFTTGDNGDVLYDANSLIYETADTISVKDLKEDNESVGNTLTLSEATAYTYSQTATHGSTIFKFRYEVKNLSSLDSQFHFNNTYIDTNDTKNGGVIWFKNDKNRISKSDGTYLESSAFDTIKTYNVEIGSLYIEYGDNSVLKDNEHAKQGNYYVYLKVDGVIQLEYYLESMPNNGNLFITGTNGDKIYDTDLIFETADVIGVNDLKKDGKQVGSRMVLSQRSTYTYNQTADHGSTIFKFNYTVTDTDTVDCQIHFNNTFLGDNGGGFWLRYDKMWLTKTVSGYVSSEYKFTELKTYKVELGSLYIESGDTTDKANSQYAKGGCYYVYLKIDNELILDYYLANMPNNGKIFMTGTNGDILFDDDWEGSTIKYYSEGSEIEEYRLTNYKENKLTKPATDPESTGKTFVGWYDEYGNKWDFDKNYVPGDMILRAGFKDNNPLPDSYFSDDNFTPVLRFIVASDVHVSGTYESRDEYILSMFDITHQYAANSSKYNKLDAALFAGDVTNGGESVQFNYFKQLVLSKLQEGTEFIVSAGNHDVGTNTSDKTAIFEQLFNEADGYIKINGYYFVWLSPDIDYAEDFSTEKAEWLDETLAMIRQEQGGSKPIFVMQHENVKDTIYGSGPWGMSSLTDVLNKYPEVVDFSGHSHYPIADPRSIWQGTFTALGTGTLRYAELGLNGYAAGGVFQHDAVGGWESGYGIYSTSAEFQIVEVDADGMIRIILYDVYSDEEIGRYYIDNATDEIKFKYSHAEREEASTKPVFDDNQKATTSLEYNRVTVTFDQATCDDVVESYRIKVYQDGAEYGTYYALSLYFHMNAPETISYTIKLPPEHNYTFKIYAVNAWNKESDDYLETSVSIGKVVFPEEVFDTTDSISINDLQISGNTGIFENIQAETPYRYNGVSPTYSAEITFYLRCGVLNEDLSEFRMQLGTAWTYYCTMWKQQGKNERVYFGWNYSTAINDSFRFTFESNTAYKIQMGTKRVVQGEHVGENYTYIKINDELITGFYCDPYECTSTNYTAAFKCIGGFSVVDESLGRQIEYISEGSTYKTVTAIKGLTTKEPVKPTKTGQVFIGWYTSEVGGERVDFSKPFNTDSQSQTVKYYARFVEQRYTVTLNINGVPYEQTVGDGGLIEIDDTLKALLVKTSQEGYVYAFDRWTLNGVKFDAYTPIHSDTNLVAVFEEKQYKISYYVDGKLSATKYYLESENVNVSNPKSNRVVLGGEHTVPSIPNANGYWVYSSSSIKEDIYANARYNGTTTTATSKIQLDAYNNNTVDIADDLTRFYLSFLSSEEQGEWLEDYPVSGGHERQDLTFSWSDSSHNTLYYVYFADNINFNNAFIIKTNKKSIDYAGIFTPGKTYYWKVAGLNGECSAVDSFKVLNVPVRWISAGTMYNVRDIGGWTTTDGKTINYGLIYRGGQLSLDNSGEKSYLDDYAYKVFDYLGMRTEIELRGDATHETNQFNEYAPLVSVLGNGYTGFFGLSDNAKRTYRNVFAALADINNYPIYFHCSWGADRTGSLGFLINGVLGVPFEQLVEDYELTSLSYSGPRRRSTSENGGFMKMYNTFMNNWRKNESQTLQDAIYNYLTEFIGVTPEQIESLKNIMIGNEQEVIQQYSVKYYVDGVLYQDSLVYEGTTVSDVTPLFFNKHLKYWTYNNEVFDPSTKVTCDLNLVAVFEDTLYEDYDVITVRDLGLGETFSPAFYEGSTIPQVYTYESSSYSGGRVLVFNYTIGNLGTNGIFDDGVHIEIGSNTWLYKAHLWIAGSSQQHIFTSGSSPTATYNNKLETGNTYKITYGVVFPINGPYAGQEMLIYMINDEIVAYLPTKANLKASNTFCFAGSEGIMKSVENKVDVKFISTSLVDNEYIENVLETKQVTRGTYIQAIDDPTLTGKVFIGWYDEYGNLWDFDNNKVLVGQKLYAKFGSKSVKATVLDSNNHVIYDEYQINVGTQVKDLIVPSVTDDKLKFNGWYRVLGATRTKLSDTDVIQSSYKVICVFDVDTTVDPVIDPTKSGCKSTVSLGYGALGMLTLATVATIKKKKKEEEE